MSRRPGGGLGSVASLARRRPPIGRLAGAYGLFVVSQYVAWVVVLVIAFKRGGATESGLVALVQLAPAAVAAPYIARLCDRYPPWTVLYGGYVVQGAGLVAAGAAAALGDVIGVYAGSVVASVAVVTARPAQAALLPRLATAPEDLTEANVLVGWIESLGVIVSGLVAGWLLAVSGPDRRARAGRGREPARRRHGLEARSPRGGRPRARARVAPGRTAPATGS